MRRHVSRGAWWLIWLIWLTPAAAIAKEAAGSSAEKLRGLGLADSGAHSPSLLRVILVFALVAALAWGATWLLKRYGFKLPGAVGASGNTGMRVLSRTSLPGGVTCHVVEARGREVLITVTRQGVSSLVLGDSASRESP